MLAVLLTMLTLAGMASMHATLMSNISRSRAAMITEARKDAIGEAVLNNAIAEYQSGGIGRLMSNSATSSFGDTKYSVRAWALPNNRSMLLAELDDGHEPTYMQAILVREATDDVRFSRAVFAKEKFSIDSNATIDSYDPDRGTYEDQKTKWAGLPLVNSNAIVQSTGDTHIKGNSFIFGQALLGIDGDDSTSIGGAVTRGFKTPLVEPEISPLVVPDPIGGSTTVVSRSAPLDVGPGSVAFGPVEIDGGGVMTIEGPAEVTMDSFELLSRGTLVIDASGGAVEITVLGTCHLNSNSAVETLAEQADRVTLVVAGVQESLDDPSPLILDSNASFIGTIFAPEALVPISSNFEVFGSVLGRWVFMDANSRLHYDERLGIDAKSRAVAEPKVRLRRRLSREQFESVSKNAGTPQTVASDQASNQAI